MSICILDLLVCVHVYTGRQKGPAFNVRTSLRRNSHLDMRPGCLGIYIFYIPRTFTSSELMCSFGMRNLTTCIRGQCHRGLRLAQIAPGGQNLQADWIHLDPEDSGFADSIRLTAQRAEV